LRILPTLAHGRYHGAARRPSRTRIGRGAQFVQKPFTPATLPRAVRRALDAPDGARAAKL